MKTRVVLDEEGLCIPEIMSERKLAARIEAP